MKAPRAATATRADTSRRSAVDDLALFTGRPAFEEPLHVGMPNVGRPEAFLARARDILERRWFTNDGSYVRELERRIAELTDVAHCVATCNGTVALALAARGVGLTGEVVVPSFTFVATAHALKWQGLTPVFSDVDERTHNLDPDHVAELITERTTGVVGVHVWGRPAYSEELTALAERHRLQLIFDAAHAVGCSACQRPIGGGGRAEILSFHATKIINTFEGGAILTNDGELAERLRAARNFGFADYDDVRALGVNGKMSEIAAAMGLTTLESFDDFVAVNRRNYEQYCAEFAGVPGVSVVPYDRRERQSFQYVVAEVDPGGCPVSRDDLLRILHAENVLARRYFYPGCHRMEPYRSLDPNVTLPATERVASRVLILPTGNAVTPGDVSVICRIVRLAVENSDALSNDGRRPRDA
jgi:dTDP-4-amino-4,6-dideoxygalactose transaminase